MIFRFTSKVGNSIKKADPDSIGNFGLGALTDYHFSDMVSVVSGTEVLFLDVHKKWLPKGQPSIKGNFVTHKLLEKYPDQFKPFTAHPLFNCNMKESFNGTLFRLPLRCPATLKESEVSNKLIGFTEIEKMLAIVQQNVGDMLLFLKNIYSIQCFTHKVS